jgi:hypothetical protein
MSASGPELTWCDVRYVVALERKAEVTRTLPEDDLEPKATSRADHLKAHP